MTPRPRLVIALALASLLSVFLVYTAVAGSSTLLVSVSQLEANKDNAMNRTVQLSGMAVSCQGGPCSTLSAPFTFTIRDDGSSTTVPVRYSGGSVPDAFKEQRRVIVTGKLVDGTFVAQRDSLVTKCPSKYSSGPTPSGT